MRIVLFGTGNVATRLGLVLQAKNIEIIQVIGRTESETSELAGLLGTSYTTSLEELSSTADLYLLTVSDDAIAAVAANLPPIGNPLIVHTAGSVTMDILRPFSKNYGVLYPLQTLSRQKEVDLSNVPVCIEASDEKNLKIIRELAGKISGQVVETNSVQRRQLHLAAVFASNFVNHFFAIGKELAQEQRLDFNLLKPLILETASRAMKYDPASVQTGPAIRGNEAVMESHLRMLEKHPEWQVLYKLISEDISKKRGD